MAVNWKGVFPAVTTKLKDDGSLDQEAIKAAQEAVANQGKAK